MIRLFPRTRTIAYVGGPLGALVGFAALWFGAGEQAESSRLLLGALGAFVGASVVLWFTKIEAAKQYKLAMSHLYTDLDPERFLEAIERWDLTKLRPAEQATTRAHWANGLVAAGRPDEALAVLDAVVLRDDERELRFTVAANKATCHLDRGHVADAQRALRAAATISANAQRDRQAAGPRRGAKPGSPGDFWLKARRTQAFQQLHLDVVRGRTVDLGVLERDFESSRAPLHRARVASLLLRAYSRAGRTSDADRMRAFVLEHGGRTTFRHLDDSAL